MNSFFSSTLFNDGSIKNDENKEANNMDSDKSVSESLMSSIEKDADDALANIYKKIQNSGAELSEDMQSIFSSNN